MSSNGGARTSPIRPPPASSSAASARSSLAEWSKSFGGQLLRRLFLALLTFMALFMLLRDGETIAARLLGLADRWLGAPGERLADRMVVAVRGVVNGTVVVAVGEGIIIGIGYLVAGVPHAVLFAILTAAFAMLPLGAWFAFTAAALVMLLEGGSGIAAALVFGWGALVMVIGDNFVQPGLIGGAARLPFLWALIGIVGGLETFGLVGLFLGPVIMAALLDDLARVGSGVDAGGPCRRTHPTGRDRTPEPFALALVIAARVEAMQSPIYLGSILGGPLCAVRLRRSPSCCSRRRRSRSSRCK